MQLMLIDIISSSTDAEERLNFFEKHKDRLFFYVTDGKENIKDLCIAINSAIDTMRKFGKYYKQAEIYNEFFMCDYSLLIICEYVFKKYLKENYESVKLNVLRNRGYELLLQAKKFADCKDALLIFNAVMQYSTDVHAKYAAMNEVGLAYKEGRGVTHNDGTAFKYFLTAAEHMNEDAIVNVGLCYLQNKGVKRDIIEAKKWFEKIYDINFDATYYLATLLTERLHGIKQNFQRARKLLKTIPKEHDKYDLAQYYLGLTYVECDKQLAIKYFDAAKSTVIDAHEELQKFGIQTAFNKKQDKLEVHQEIKSEPQPENEKDDIAKLRKLALDHKALAKKEQQHTKKALRMYKQVALHEGASPADWHAYGMYLQERGRTDDANEWLKKAADKGYRPGLLGWLPRIPIPQFLTGWWYQSAAPLSQEIKAPQVPKIETKENETKLDKPKPAPVAELPAKLSDTSSMLSATLSVNLYDSEELASSQIETKESKAIITSIKPKHKKKSQTNLLDMLLKIEEAIIKGVDSTVFTIDKLKECDIQKWLTFSSVKIKVKELFKSFPREFYQYLNSLNLLEYVLSAYYRSYHKIKQNNKNTADWIDEKISDSETRLAAVILAVIAHVDYFAKCSAKNFDIEKFLQNQLQSSTAMKFEINDNIADEFKKLFLELNSKINKNADYFDTEVLENESDETDIQSESADTFVRPNYSHDFVVKVSTNFDPIPKAYSLSTLSLFTAEHKHEKLPSPESKMERLPLKSTGKLPYSIHPAVRSIMCELKEVGFPTYMHGSRAYDPPTNRIDEARRDFDLVTSASQAEVMSRFRNFPDRRPLEVSDRFGHKIYCCKMTLPTGQEIEIRCNAKIKDLRDDIPGHDTALRCLYVDEDGNIYDPTGLGLKDKENKTLTFLSDTKELFFNNPVLIPEVIYLISKGFKILQNDMDNLHKALVPDDKETKKTCSQYSLRQMLATSPLLLLNPLTKNFLRGNATYNFELLASTGVWDVLFPNALPIVNRPCVYNALWHHFQQCDHTIYLLSTLKDLSYINQVIDGYKQKIYVGIVIAEMADDFRVSSSVEFEQKYDAVAKKLPLIGAQPYLRKLVRNQYDLEMIEAARQHAQERIDSVRMQNRV